MRFSPTPGAMRKMLRSVLPDLTEPSAVGLNQAPLDRNQTRSYSSFPYDAIIVYAFIIYACHWAALASSITYTIHKYQPPFGYRIMDPSSPLPYDLACSDAVHPRTVPQ